MQTDTRELVSDEGTTFRLTRTFESRCVLETETLEITPVHSEEPMVLREGDIACLAEILGT